MAAEQKLFEFRLEAQDGSGHYRSGRISAADEASAREYLERQEQRKVDAVLNEAAMLGLAEQVLGADADDAAKKKLAAQFEKEGLKMNGFSQLPGFARGALATHHQSKPYKLKTLKAV